MAAVLLFLAPGLLVLPGLARPLGRRLPPESWAKLCAWGLGAGAVALELAAAILGAHAALGAADLHAHEEICHWLLGPLEAPGAGVGWVAGIAAVALPGLASVGLVRARRAQDRLRPEPWLGQRRWHRGHPVVVLPTDQPIAVCVARPSSQIVVSQGLIAVLEPDELVALLDHEAAHIERRHHGYLLVATAVEHAVGVVPFVRTSSRSLRVAIERWADEAAVGANQTARHTLRRAVLATSSALVATRMTPAFTGADAVAERLDALEADPPDPRTLTRLALGSSATALVAIALTMAGWATAVACS